MLFVNLNNLFNLYNTFGGIDMKNFLTIADVCVLLDLKKSAAQKRIEPLPVK